MLYQDTGFQDFALKDVIIIQPKKKPRGGKLTDAEKAENRRISSIRMRIEHAIGGVKRYRIVKDKIRLLKEETLSRFIYREMAKDTDGAESCVNHSKWP
jgi:hypothetical protein